MSEINDLLDKAESEDKNERKDAIIDLGKLEFRYQPAIDLLEQISNNDEDKKNRKEAEKSLKSLLSKPEPDVLVDSPGGSDNTAFDDKIGDETLEKGEFDVESNFNREEEEYRKVSSEGKGLHVLIKEKNSVTVSSSGEILQTQESAGRMSVLNTGDVSRISGIELLLNNINLISPEIELDAVNKIGALPPGMDHQWKVDYTFVKEFTPIKVEQVYEDPVTNLSPNFTGGAERVFDCKITIVNTSDRRVNEITGIKTLNSHAELLGNTCEKGDVQSSGSEVKFTIPELDVGETVLISLNLKASLPESENIYKSGNLSISYSNVDSLSSGLEFGSINGVSDIRHRVRKRQRDNDPTYYDCEIIFENLTEFIYDLNRFTVFADNIESQQIILDWDGSQAIEAEREIIPHEKVVYEFTFESPEFTPSFGEYLEFSVQNIVEMETLTELTIPEEELKFMAIEIRKSYLIDGESVLRFEVPSYIETAIPVLVKLKGAGTYPLEGIVIRDEIPSGFRPPIATEVSVKRGSELLPSEQYSLDISDTELIVNINHLQETSIGGLHEGEEIVVEFSAIADRPEPSSEPILTRAYGEAFSYDAPESKVTAVTIEEGLELVIIHKRDSLDVGKIIQSIEYNGKNAYKIQLEAENYGSSIITFNIDDLVPNGFEFLADTVETLPVAEVKDSKKVDDGIVFGWVFQNVNPDETAKISYIVVEDSIDADPRKLQSIYQG
ncbi:MAG: hypothetical protein OEZ01_01100 [Candidatus Heimdallarchaeota archaeon]|nr:hypothetical protein [Candidatus Heimdallarchaeota archaeon]MDH5644570.1 hypothetical protein [Candidatus Heimdallarchaeota archaeon]